MLELRPMKRLIAFSFLLFFCLVFSSRNVAFAQASQEEVRLELEVDHVANVIEKFKEKVTLFFKFSKEDKFNYQKFLLEKRLAELKYIVDSKEWNPVEETSSRYATYLGKFTGFIVESNLKGKKEEILSMYGRHKLVLEELQKNFEFESGWWLLLQHDINSTEIFSSQLR